jgi:hypothetical protein
VDKANEEKLKTWMRDNGLGRLAVTEFVRGAHFASVRAKAVDELKLRMKQGT